ncbi:DMT family transporter [Desmospora activa]|uniref:Paired small multidrug resistance pump n=1 Tax=Desmospora activa DSM 45169 TaxID=1121389 RepID=A0A2T4ZA60_9BACL|nr:multidrug efflux SMR transporter [Desmospora activa]PTM58781.1 paired small multidrug resistance pump [Desmospora activa DSM 45169]
MAWVYLILAGLFEVVGVTMINQLHQNRDWRSFLLLVLGFGTSFALLAVAMKELPMGTAYAVWTGIGAAGSALVGMAIYGEARDGWRLFFLALILIAVIGLKVVSG